MSNVNSYKWQDTVLPQYIVVNRDVLDPAFDTI